MNYSKGMKKKLALICALHHEPRQLILDDPTNGLDTNATRTLHAKVSQLAAGGTTVFNSTHLLYQAERLCHRVGIVFKGRLAGVGTMEELRRNQSPDSTLEEIFFSVTRESTEPPPVAGP